MAGTASKNSRTTGLTLPLYGRFRTVRTPSTCPRRPWHATVCWRLPIVTCIPPSAGRSPTFSNSADSRERNADPNILSALVPAAPAPRALTVHIFDQVADRLRSARPPTPARLLIAAGAMPSLPEHQYVVVASLAIVMRQRRALRPEALLLCVTARISNSPCSHLK